MKSTPAAIIAFAAGFAVFLTVSGCSKLEEPAKTPDSLAARFASRIEYVKDERTNFCFALNSPGSNGQTMAMVPCTPEVEALLVRK